jgi:hypothetical protein
MTNRNESITITAENSWTDAIGVSENNNFDISISGTFVATITLQRSYDKGLNWFDTDTFTSAGEWQAAGSETNDYRIGVKTGNFTSGTISVRIGN